MGWTVPKSWASGEVLTAANMNTHVRDNLSFLNPGATGAGVPVLHVSNNTARSFTANVEVNLIMDTILNDTASGWDGVHGKYIVPTAGTYMVGVSAGEDGSKTTIRRVSIGWGPTAATYFIRVAEFQPSELAPLENAFAGGAHCISVNAGDEIALRYSIAASGTVTPNAELTAVWLCR